MERDEREGDAPKEWSYPKAPSAVEDAPDPEEDDLDDLDDMLDEFSATKIFAAKEVPPKQEPWPAEGSKDPEVSDVAAIEFSKQLQDQMAALMGTVDESPGMKREIEAMMRELGAATDPGAAADQFEGAVNGQEPPSGSDEPFQKTIRKTMERMQASGEEATAAAKSEESDDMLAQMLKEVQNGGLQGTGDDEGFNKMLMGMMEQLTNKDILYEPMKELHDKFPAWMAKNQGRTGADDLKRHGEQQRLVGEIVRKFEQKGYSDSKAEDREFIVERMQQMQAAGSPPADLVGDMNAASDTLGDIDSGCAPQ